MKRLTHTAVALMLIAAPVAAQNTGKDEPDQVGPDAAGTISGTIDLIESVWHVVEAEQGPDSFWHRTADGMRVQIAGYPTRVPADTTGALIVSFEFDATVDSASPEDVRVELLPGGPGGAEERLTAKDMNTEADISAVNVLGGDLVIAGSLNATLTPGHPGGLIIDTDDSYPDAKSLDIDFQVTIYESDPGR